VGWWRSVQGSHNGFYRESFIDELAHAAGQDPIAYRRHLLRNSPRHLACFELAVEKSPELPKGQHRGVAIFKSFGSIVATVLDLSVADDWLKVHQITTAVDCGRIVHPDTIHAQMMSASLMGLSAALYGKMSFVDGSAQQQNFHQYKLLSMREAPPVHSYIVDSDERPGGVGEVALPPLAGALGNALFSATGIRVRELPLADVMVG
jgi:isoquinoline 1-oxidoreductase beta subunit